MNIKNTFKEIDVTLTELIDEFNLFTQEQVNKVPFEGSWTPGRVVQHVILSDSGFVSLLNAGMTDTDRPYDEHLQTLKTIFLNFDIKMQSPDFIFPPAVDYNKDELLHTLENIKAQLNQFDITSDMTLTCIGLKLPKLGYLTRTEVVHFILYHTQRHVHQLKNIYNHINHN